MVGRAVLDTSVIIEVFERKNIRLLSELTRRYDELYTAWVCLYEYLFGFKYLGRDIAEEKSLVEEALLVAYPDQRTLEEALELDVKLSKRGQKIPFSDVLIAAQARQLEATVVTLDEKHFSRLRSIGVEAELLKSG